MLKICGKPVIEHMIRRILHARLAGSVILCTTNQPDDDVFTSVAKRCGIVIFRGHHTDILKRWLDAADHMGARYFISAEADDVFCDPEHIDAIITELRKNSYDYVACRGLPFGVTPTGIRVEALRKICSLKKDTDTEGQERFFTKTGLFRVHYIQISDPQLMNSAARMTLDYPEDFEFFKTVFSYLDNGGNFFSLREILTLLEKHPELIEINKKMQTVYQQRYDSRYGKVQLKKEKPEQG